MKYSRTKTNQLWSIGIRGLKQFEGAAKLFFGEFAAKLRSLAPLAKSLTAYDAFYTLGEPLCWFLLHKIGNPNNLIVT